MLIDQYLPQYHTHEYHHITVNAPIEHVYHTLRQTDLTASPVIQTLFALRQLPAFLFRLLRRRQPDARPPLTLNNLVKSGFILLGEQPPNQLLLGLAGQFWTPTGNLQNLDPAGFQTFDTPGHARTVWGFTLTQQPGGTTHLATETRIQCNDPASRRKFRLYWLLIGPFSGLIRIIMLRTIKRAAETGQTYSNRQ